MTDRPPAPASLLSDTRAPDTVAAKGQSATIDGAGAKEHLPDAAAALRGNSGLTDLPADFGRYRLEQLLGRGGMGAVYRAYDTQLDRHVALKVSIFGRDEGALRERFLREARAAATLHHPNLCPVFDIGEQDGIIYLTMAYIDGKPLSHYLNAKKVLPAPKVAALVRDLAKALQEAHDRGIIHRDLKPSNILINRKKEPIVTDFGLARRETSQDARLTQTGAMMGTPAYMPPEQVNGEVALMGPGCDIYSLGIILYEMLANRRPFDGPMGVLMAQIVTHPPPPLTALRPDLDPTLEAICFQALAKRPQDRYPSMRAFAGALDSWLAGERRPSEAGSQKSEVRSRRPRAGQATTIDFPPPTSDFRPPASEPEQADLLAFMDELEAAKPAAVAGAPATKKRRGVWIFVIFALIFVTCVLPVGWAVTMLSQLVNKVSEGVGKFGQKFEDQQKEQNRLREQRNKEKRQLEEAARAWKPPPAEVASARLFPENVGGYRLAENDDKANVAELDLTHPGRRAVYRGNQAEDAAGTVEVFAYRASKLEKEAVLMKAIGRVTPGLPGLFVPGIPGVPSVLGSADGTYLSYDFGSQKAAAGQYGTFVWQDGWLILARASTPLEPGAFLKAYLSEVK